LSVLRRWLSLPPGAGALLLHEIDGNLDLTSSLAACITDPMGQGKLILGAMVQHLAQGCLLPRKSRIDPCAARKIKKKMSSFGKKRPEHYHSLFPVSNHNPRS